MLETIKNEISEIESQIFLSVDTIKIISDITRKACAYEEIPPDYYSCILDIFEERAGHIIKQCEKLDNLILKIGKDLQNE